MADIELLKKLRKNKRISITKQMNSLYSLIQNQESYDMVKDKLGSIQESFVEAKELNEEIEKVEGEKEPSEEWFKEVEAAVKKALDEANSYFEQVETKDGVEKMSMNNGVETHIKLKKLRFESISKRILDINELIGKNAPAKKVDVMNKKLLENHG